MKIGFGKLAALLAATVGLGFGRRSAPEVAPPALIDVPEKEEPAHIEPERVAPTRVKRKRPVKTVTVDGRTRKNWYSPDSPEVKAMVSQQQQKIKAKRGKKK
nr:hypothetical protein [uncultured Vibrio sp.]